MLGLFTVPPDPAVQKLPDDKISQTCNTPMPPPGIWAADALEFGLTDRHRLSNILGDQSTTLQMMKKCSCTRP